MTATLRKFALVMSEHYHTPVSYWLELELRELHAWASAARELNEEKNKQ